MFGISDISRRPQSNASTPGKRHNPDTPNTRRHLSFPIMVLVSAALATLLGNGMGGFGAATNFHMGTSPTSVAGLALPASI